MMKLMKKGVVQNVVNVMIKKKKIVALLFWLVWQDFLLAFY